MYVRRARADGGTSLLALHCDCMKQGHRGAEGGSGCNPHEKGLHLGWQLLRLVAILADPKGVGLVLRKDFAVVFVGAL